MLARFTGDTVSRAKAWASLPADELRRRAVTAANDRNCAELWGLTEAFLLLHGSAGAKVSPHTREAYRLGVRDLCRAWQAENLLRPSRDAAPVWLRTLEDEGKSPATCRVKVAAARALYRALRWAGATSVAPFEDARPARDPTPAWDKRQPYSRDELERLLDRASPEDRAMVLLGAHAGLRVGEITALRWADVDLEAGELTTTGKGMKVRHVPLSASLTAALQEVGRSGDERIFPFTVSNARYRMRVLCRRAGVSYKGMHSLRHAAGTRLYAETGSLEDCARHLGHASVETSRTYAKWSDEGLKGTVRGW